MYLYIHIYIYIYHLSVHYQGSITGSWQLIGEEGQIEFDVSFSATVAPGDVKQFNISMSEE
jgi:hypothetical protein